MKHSWKITSILVAIFLITQLFGLATISRNIDVVNIDGEIIIEHQDTIVGQPQKTQSGAEAVGILTLAILIGTLLILLLIKLKISSVFRYWYLFAVFTTMAVTLGVYIDWFSENLNITIIFVVAGFLAWFKVYRQDFVVHNVTEILVYTGIAVLFVSLLEGWLWAAFVLLIIISVYDMFAVWQSKHMIKIAKYQTESRVFAGLSIPYKLPKPSRKSHKKARSVKKSVKMAILGGGDIAFPLLFSGAVMSHLILEEGLGKSDALLFTSIISITTTVALLLLFVKGKSDKFYPAMPFLSVGCFLGYGLIFLLL